MGDDGRGVLCALGPYADVLVPGLRAALPDEDVRPLPAAGEPPPPPADVLVTLAPTADDLDRALAAGVRWVHVLAAGVDGVPLDRIGADRVDADCVVTCSRGAAAPAIAEFVLAAMLAFEKRLPESWLTGPPERWNVASLGGLRGRTVGLVGFGAIARAIAARALGFEMRVVAVRRTSTPSDLDGVAILDSLEELLGCSDHVVLAAPATADTHHLVDAAALAAMRRGAHLVNVARGSLVDQHALLDALESGRLGLASLDVVDPEPLPAGHPLYGHPKVRLSAHISWSSPDTVRRTVEAFLDNHRRRRAGKPLTGVVDLAKGY